MKLLSFENRLLKKICSPVRYNLNGKRNRKNSMEVRKIVKRIYITSYMSSSRPPCSGHVIRSHESRGLRKVFPKEFMIETHRKDHDSGVNILWKETCGSPDLRRGKMGRNDKALQKRLKYKCYRATESK